MKFDLDDLLVSIGLLVAAVGLWMVAGPWAELVLAGGLIMACGLVDITKAMKARR